MFFFLSKFLSFLLAPVTWIFILLIWAWRTKDENKKRRLRIAAVIVLVIFSNRFILDRTMHAWEVNVAPEPKAGTYDAIIVLGGVSSWDEENNRIQFNRAGDRLLQAIALWKKGVAPKIIFTGGSGSVRHPEHTEGKFVQDYCRTLGIPDSAMIFEWASHNTHDNATQCKPLLQKYAPGGKYLLVTSAFHMRRSLGCFEKQGIRVSPYSTDRYSGPMKWDFEYLFIPDSEPLSDWEALLHEWVGCVMYKIAGYI
jgi:uncharacterized SAM-binding protein YcdF (DUF218 family)